MEKLATSTFKLGILGGGQLGRMLALKAADWDIKTYCLDESEDAPAKAICHHFQKGSIRSFEDVIAFGQDVDAVTIESDDVNAEALIYLESQGKKVYPSGKTLLIIQDKGLQRQFCEQAGLPVPRYEIFQTKQELMNSGWQFPFIAKTCRSGYDGKGVFLIKQPEDFERLPDTRLLAEEKIEIKKELTVIAVRNAGKAVTSFPVTELYVHPSSYIVDYLICPAPLEPAIEIEAKKIAQDLINAFDISGILAVEMFLDQDNRLWINECSPRPHNSGHHTIEGCLTSQYEQHLRGILNLPLGSCESKGCAGMLNLLGEENVTGPVRYEGLTDCLKMKGVKLHIYGKKTTTPNRKMGHITIISNSYGELQNNIEQIKTKVKVRT